MNNPCAHVRCEVTASVALSYCYRILLILLTATESITSNFVILTCVYIMKP